MWRMNEVETNPIDLRARVRKIIHEGDTPAGKAFDVAIIIAIIDEPPYDIIGRGAPTIGSRPKTIDMFTMT